MKHLAECLDKKQYILVVFNCLIQRINKLTKTKESMRIQKQQQEWQTEDYEKPRKN